jgi:hypothetical protein
VRLPIYFASGSLTWTSTGTVWAWWRVDGLNYRYAAEDRKLDLLEQTRAVVATLGSDAAIVSLCARIDPGAVAGSIVSGHDIDAREQLARSTLATLEGLDRVELYQRVYYLGVALTGTSRLSQVATSWTAARAAVSEQLGLLPPPPRVSARRDRARQAAELGEQYRRYLPVRPATREELLWMIARAPRRGLADPVLPQAGQASEPITEHAGRLRGPTLAPYGEPRLLEGGTRDDDGPRGLRPYVRVEIEDVEGSGNDVGYQSFLALAEPPDEFTFPGTEWFSAADTLDFPVDWVARIHATDNDEAQRKAARRARVLDRQTDEYAGDTAGPPAALMRAQELSAAERVDLADNRGDPELGVSTVFCVWSPELAECQDRAKRLRAAYGGGQFRLGRPSGHQTALFEALLPGAAYHQVLRDYEQKMMPKAFAAGMPFAASEVGDPVGGLYGFSTDDHTVRPVLLDPSLGPRSDPPTDANVLFVGNMGGGKSYAMKRLAEYQLDIGSQCVALDLSLEGEWVRALGAVTDSLAVLPIGGAGAADGLSMDPLRVFSGPEAIQRAKAMMVILTGIDSREVEGITLGEAIKTVHERGGRAVNVVDELLRRGKANARTDPEARIVGRKLAALLEVPDAAIIFGDGEALDIHAAQATVFHAPNLQLPGEQANRDDLLDEQVVSEALLYGMAAVARKITFRDKSRYGFYIADEYGLYRHNPPAAQMINESVTGGRKNFAGTWVGAQSIAQVPDVLHKLMAIVAFYRMSRAAAREVLTAFEIPHDEALLDRIEQFAAGEQLLRDRSRRYGMVRVATSAIPERAHAFETNPTSPAGPTGPPQPTQPTQPTEPPVPAREPAA